VYVTASKHAFEQDFGQRGTGHSYEIYFQLHVLFQDLHSVTSGFGVYDRDSIGRHFNYNVPVAIDFPWQQFLQFGHQSSQMACQVG
jgi:hypothetical protein